LTVVIGADALAARRSDVEPWSRTPHRSADLRGDPPSSSCGTRSRPRNRPEIVPALGYPREKGEKKLFLIGADVFPGMADTVILAYAAAHGMQIRGEDFTGLGQAECRTVVNKMRDEAGCGFNAIHRTIRRQGLRPFAVGGPAELTVTVVTLGSPWPPARIGLRPGRPPDALVRRGRTAQCPICEGRAWLRTSR
jgi:hypothetical protein